MEILLPKRNTVVISLSLLVLVLIIVVYALIQGGMVLTPEKVEDWAKSHIMQLERSIEVEISSFEKRSRELLKKFRKGNLDHRELVPREALIIEENGDIARYYGEIYHFEMLDLRKGQWHLINMGRDVFVLAKPAPQIYYIRFLLNTDHNVFLKSIANHFSFVEMVFNKRREPVGENRFEKTGDMYRYRHRLKPARGQFLLDLRFTGDDIESEYRAKWQGLFLLFMLIYLGLNLVYHLVKGNIFYYRLIWFLGLIDLFVMASSSKRDDLYFRLWFWKLDSVFQVLVVAVFLLSLCYLFSKSSKYKSLNLFLFNLSLPVILVLSGKILKGVDFVYADFSLSPHYLGLLLSLFFLHLIPLMFLRRVALVREFAPMAGMIVFQLIIMIVVGLVIGLPPVNLILFLLLLPFVTSGREGFLSRLLVMFLLAVSIFLLVSSHTEWEKKEFISNNLKNIFLNQKNYAKFIAREMVHEINSSSSTLADFYQESSTSKLVDIWRTSIARRENIASGIFLLSPDGEVRDQYYYQFPLLRLTTQNFFPFWAIEDTTADLFGNEHSLAIASASVKKRQEHLGYIVIQVLNSPRLILRHQDKINIFTIDNQVDGMDFSYIKFNRDNQIVENPSNINLENTAPILHSDNRWFGFKFTGLFFHAYIFKHDQDSIIIFFPGNTFFNNFSEIVKIFLFLCLFMVLYYFRELKKVEWRAIYYSFSIRVFAILILVSLVTAIVFTLFSLNFYIQSSERKLRQMKYERGSTAQNIAYNFINENEEFTQERLFLMSDILKSDVSLYENGVFLDSSNQRKSIDSDIPIYLHSYILDQLNEKNLKFVISDQGNQLFFKVNDYIFEVEFAYNWRKIFTERTYQSDFIISLFFILIVIGFSSAFFLRNKILSPINEMNRGMAAVEKGRMEKLDKIPSEAEIKSLYLGFNSMVEGIRREKQNISEMSRMKTIIKLGRRVAHEVKNPLTPIKLSAEQILRSLADKNSGYEEIIKKSVHFIMDETEHLRKVSFGFLDLSRLDEILAEEFDLIDLMKEEIFAFNQLYPNTEFLVQGENESFLVYLDKIKLKQVITNLLLNSIDAIGERAGKITLSLGNRDNRVLLELVDNGVGMEPGEVDKIFDLDYSTKEIGTGLGLFIVKRIVELHGGKITIRSVKNEGTTVLMDLPERVRN